MLGTGCGGLGAQLVCCQGWLPLCLLLHLPLGHTSVPRGIEGMWLERTVAAPQGACVQCRWCEPSAASSRCLHLSAGLLLSLFSPVCGFVAQELLHDVQDLC